MNTPARGTGSTVQVDKIPTVSPRCAAVRRDVRRKNCDDARDVDGKRKKSCAHRNTRGRGSFLPLPAPAHKFRACAGNDDIQSALATMWLLDVLKYHGQYWTIRVRVRVLSLNRVLPLWDSPTPCHGLKANSLRIFRRRAGLTGFISV
jgi:hypothetical protein